MNHPRITAAIIALNEERNLAELLPQLDWVDQIVVVDGGSTDRTVRIARRHGCRVVLRVLDTFACQRNRAWEAADGDWILSIDADERLGKALVSEIRAVMVQSRYAAYRIPIHSTIFGRRLRWSGTQDDRPVRLFRQGAARWVGDVHEVLRVEGRIGCLGHGLDHRTLPDLDAFLTKMHRYTWLEARARVAARRPSRTRDLWWSPLREVLRRLFWKRGILDGPEGWSFCLLSGLSEWTLAERHRRLWQAAAVETVSRPRPPASQTASAGTARGANAIPAESASVCGNQ